jgi:hypothetical protein
MQSPQAEQAIEEKMDSIEEILEEIVLDTVISLLIKVCERNQVFAKHYRRCNCYRTDCKQRDDIPF